MIFSVEFILKHKTNRPENQNPEIRHNFGSFKQEYNHLSKENHPMKYWMLPLCWLLTLSFSYSQQLPLNKETGKIEYTDTVPLGGNRNELFSRGKAVVESTFKSARDVVEAEGKEEGYILLRGLTFLDISSDNDQVTEIPMHFRLHLKFRNNEYSYSITDITLQSPTDSLPDRTPLEETLITRDEFRKLTIEELKEAGIPTSDAVIDQALAQAMMLNNQYKSKAHSAISGIVALIKERMAQIKL